MKTLTYAVGTFVLLLLGISNDVNSRMTEKTKMIVPEKRIMNDKLMSVLESEDAVVLLDDSCPDHVSIRITWKGRAAVGSQSYLDIRESTREHFESFGLYNYLGSDYSDTEIWFVSYGRYSNPCRAGEIIRGEIRESPEVEEDDD